MIPSCKEVSRLVSEGLDRDLSFGERVALRVHLLMCKGCRNFEAQMMVLRDAMRDLSQTEDERLA